MVWWPFAPQLERADTTEVIDLNNGAPPLHSASFVVKDPWAHGRFLGVRSSDLGPQHDGAVTARGPFGVLLHGQACAGA